MTIKNETNTKQLFSAVMTTCSILSALMVVWIHAYNVEVYSDANRVIFWIQEALSQGLARGAVPFFLMSSAFFLYSKEKKVTQVYLSRAKSILVPYLLWNTVYMVAFAVLRHLSLSNTGMDTVTVSNVAQGLFLHKYNYAYWFMRDLIVLVALYPLLKWVIRRGKAVAMLGLAALIAGFYCGAEWLDSAVYYFIGAIIGYHYRDYAERAVEMKREWRIAFTVGWLCVAGVLFWLKNVCKIDQVELFRDLAMAFLLFFAVSAFRIRIGGWFAALSFMIYSLHPLILEMVEKLIYLYCPHTDLWMMADYVAAPLICLGIVVVVCLLWKKLLPTVYTVFNGGRL